MLRNELTDYLQDEGCYPEENGTTPVGEMWHNCINGATCHIPFGDDLPITTWAGILYELKVAPPPVDGYDSDYAVYIVWREKDLQAHLANKAEKDKN
jgi:hypothetical protein